MGEELWNTTLKKTPSVVSLVRFCLRDGCLYLYKHPLREAAKKVFKGLAIKKKEPF